MASLRKFVNGMFLHVPDFRVFHFLLTRNVIYGSDGLSCLFLHRLILRIADCAGPDSRVRIHGEINMQVQISCCY